MLALLLATAIGSAINQTVLDILASPAIYAHATEKPTSIGQETAQIMLLECNESVVANQGGVYPDQIVSLLSHGLHIKNATVISDLAKFVQGCPRIGMGPAVVTFQQAFVSSFFLEYNAVMVTCDSLWWHAQIASYAAPPDPPPGIQRYEQLIYGSNSTTALEDTLLMLTAFAVGHQTGALPHPPP